MEIAYAKPSDCIDIVPALTQSQEDSVLLEAGLHQSLIDASRLFESEIFAPTNYFNKAKEEFEERLFYGNGTEFVRLAPFVEVGDVRNFEDELVDSDEYRIFISEVYSPTGYYLRWSYWKCFPNFFKHSPLKITARWGFDCIPPDVRIAVKNMGCLMFLTNSQNRLGQNLELDSNQEIRLRNTYNRILSSWQDKFHHFNLGII